MVMVGIETITGGKMHRRRLKNTAVVTEFFRKWDLMTTTTNPRGSLGGKKYIVKHRSGKQGSAPQSLRNRTMASQLAAGNACDRL
jgi:hypothetical protein